MKFRQLRNRFFILLIIFIVALAWFYMYSLKAGTPLIIYTYDEISQPQLPVIYIDTCGRSMNVCRGYTTDIVGDIAYDTLSILSDDRRLSLHIKEGARRATSVSYEVRSADGTDLIESTTLGATEIRDGQDSQDVTLPIQNLISRDRSYLLKVILTLSDENKVYYYSRIAFDDTGAATRMVDIASDFSQNNFDYQTARNNTQYIEPDETGDNSSLAHVTINSSYDQLTYREMSLITIGSVDIRLSEYEGNMGEVSVSRVVQDDRGRYYDIKENFVMRVGPERIFMMDYDRTMEQIFTATPNEFTESRIMLGINDSDGLSVVRSDDGNYVAFVVNKDLWLYDVRARSCRRIYTLRANDRSDIRGTYGKYDIRILSCDDEGQLVFLVDGYMSRGAREGQVGVDVFRYDATTNELNEMVFIASSRRYEDLKEDLDTLCYLSERGLLYIKLSSSLFSINITSHEVMTLADNLQIGSYSVNDASNLVAWQEDPDDEGSTVIHFMNLMTGDKKQLSCSDDMLIKPLGFIDYDFIVGTCEIENKWILNGTDRGIPYSYLDILDTNLVSQERYARDDCYIWDVSAQGSRIHVQLLEKTGTDSYSKAEEDTIVCNIAISDNSDEALESYADRTYGRMYFISHDGSVNTQISNDTYLNEMSSSNVGVLSIEPSRYESAYCAYAKGAVIGTYSSLADAIESCYDDMGKVRGSGGLMYCRGALTSYRIMDASSLDATSILQKKTDGSIYDLLGITLRQATYYISRGYPILAYTAAGDEYLIYGYDRSRDVIAILNIADGSTTRTTYEVATELFEDGFNDFYCAFTVR